MGMMGGSRIRIWDTGAESMRVEYGEGCSPLHYLLRCFGIIINDDDDDYGVSGILFIFWVSRQTTLLQIFTAPAQL